MYSNQDYKGQPTDGVWDFDSGEFTTADGKVWVGIGSLDYGNNCCLEVMALKEKPTEFDEPFRHNQFPVFVHNNDDGEDGELGIPLPEFLQSELEQDGHHIPTILAQLGSALHKYCYGK